jgi:cardiolipin synthase
MRLLPSEWALILTIVDYAVVAVMVPRIITERRESAATLAWVLTIVFVPFVGILCYGLFGARRLHRTRLQRRRRRKALPIGGNLRKAEAVAEDLRAMGLHALPGTSPICGGNRVALLDEAQPAYDRMLQAIAAARAHVHVEFYIFQPDRIGRRFLGQLAERAKAGVEVRLLVDDVGSFSLRRRHVRPLLDAGGRYAVFNPVNPFRGFGFHLRNHRKIVVVDGQTAFTGGLNVGDTFRARRGRKSRLGPWRDTHLELVGPIATHLQEVFAEDWHFAAGEALLAGHYYPVVPPHGEVSAQIVASGPDAGREAIHLAIIACIHAARERVWLTTPYFIPGQALLVALELAARRGVDVRILLPGRSDARLVLWAGRSYYEELMAAGVRIHEYQAGMLHAKIVTVDRRWAIVGSANLDRRSFSLNFEAGAILYDRGLAEQLDRRFVADLAAAKPATVAGPKDRFRRLAEAASSMMAPLL